MSSSSTSLPPLSERLQTLTESLAAARTREDVFAVVLTPALEAVDAVAGAVLLVDETGERLTLAATQGNEEGAQTLWQDGPLDGNVPAGDALERREPLFFEREGDLVRTYPELEARTGGVAAVATAVLPMFLDDGPLGTIILDFQEPHHFTPEEVRFLRTLAAQCALALGRANLHETLTAEVQRRTHDLEAARRTAEVLAGLGDALQAADSPEEVARLALERLGPAVEAIGMNIVRLEGESLQATTFWGQVPQNIRTFMTQPGRKLSDTPNLLHVARTRQPLYFDDYQATGAPVPGFPALSGAAVPILTPVGTLVGFVVTWRPAGLGPLSEGGRDLLRRAAATLGLVLERAAATRQLAEDRAALDAFVAYKEAVGGASDVLTLARQAAQVVRANLEHVSVAYYELEGGLWKARVWSEDIPPDLIAQITAGVSQDAPSYAGAARTGAPLFVDGWDADANGVPSGASYGAAAFLPLSSRGEARSLFSVGTREARTWTEREKALVRAVARGLSVTLERTEHLRQLQVRNDEEARRTQALTAFAELSRDLVLETGPLVLIRRTQEIVLRLLPAGFSVYFEPREGLWRIRSQVGQANTPELQATLEAGLPFGAASNLLTPWRSGQPHYQDEYDPALDHLTGSEAYPGASVTIPIRVGGQTLGILGFALYTVRSWSREDRAVLATVERQLTLALERAEQTRRLEEEREALAAFARFTEASTHTTDTLTLAQGARDVLRATLGVEVGYSELEDGLWKGRVFSENTPPEVEAQSRQGFPADLPAFARPFQERDVVFVDGWDPQGAEHTEVYGAAALYPYFEAGQPRGLLTMGTSQARAWTERERSVFRSVGRSLALAFERAEHARQLQVQNAELDARTRALEGFADLTRDLSVEADPYVLVRRGQAVALSLLPEGYALYFEPEGDRWVLRGQTGDLRSEALQAAADAGLPYDEANNLLIPYHSRAPYYQDQYARDTDNLDGMVAHLGASATLPVIVNGQVRGVFAVVLFGGARHWTRPDQAALESVVRSLGLALERAGHVAVLETRTREVSEWRERYEVAVKGSGHLLYDWDPATDAILYGGAVEQITGYTAGELDGNLGDWTERLIHPDDRETFARVIERVTASGDEAHVAFRLLHKDGQVREVEDDGYFKRNARGEVTRMVGFIKDVTERKRAEEALLHANEELRRSNAELEQFAYVASHDLQAPIRAVTSFAGVIDRRYGSELDERGRLYLRQIVEGGEHMKRLVDDLLAFSRVHTRRGDLLPVDSGAVFDRVIRRLQPEAQEAGAQVTRGELPLVLADAQQLDQLLQNLISNGLKYRRPGVAPRVHVGAERGGECWRFAVSDNGIGIEPQYFERIFVIFQRLHGREQYEGTGIGLAVCKKIVEQHGGRLWLDSRVGQGSTFFFTLPAG